MKTQKIVTFGELLLRFSKPGQLRLTQGDMFTSKYGGSEANVAVSLATQGEDVTYITRLPDTPVGHAGAQCMAQLGVDISRIVYGGQRIGTYYFEPAAGMRAAKVVYDRDYSAYYDLAPGMIDWRSILKDADIFQVSGITAAISQQAADATLRPSTLPRRWALPSRLISTTVRICGNMVPTHARPCNACCRAVT